MNIYLAYTVRGDRGALDSTRAIAAVIARLGHSVLTTHLLDDGVEAAESALSEREVFERDLAWLSRADAMIAEASGSSFGVGFELGYFLAQATGTPRRALLVYAADRRDAVSRLAVGNSHPNCLTYAYDAREALQQCVTDFLAHSEAGMLRGPR